jgi:hypothetical protein
MSSSTVNLNVFTNVTSLDTRDCLVPEAVKSFFHCFGDEINRSQVITRIFIDPKPHRQNFEAWVAAIGAGLPDHPFEIVQTDGLVDGFWRSVHMSEGEYAMQLEHDFVFLRERIPHSWPQLTQEMQRSHLNFIRFNKRRNVQAGYDFFMERDEFAEVPLSRISGRSNNPHIIHVPFYRDLYRDVPDITVLGLEGGLCRRAGGGHMYGAPGWPRSVQHLDGRHVRLKDGIARALWLARERGLTMFKSSRAA